MGKLKEMETPRDKTRSSATAIARWKEWIQRVEQRQQGDYSVGNSVREIDDCKS